MTLRRAENLSRDEHLPQTELHHVSPRRYQEGWQYEKTARRLILLVLLYTIPGVVALKPVLDPDIWWHLRTGQWIVEHGVVPYTDPFSSYGMGKPWVAYSWLAEVFLYGFYRAFGLMGIVFYLTAFCIGITFALHRFICKRVSHFPTQIVLTVVGLLGIIPILGPRPLLFSVLFFIIEVDLLLTARQTGDLRRLLVLPPLFALWANLHIQFVYGLSVLGLVVAESLILRVVTSRNDQGADRSLPLPALVGVMVACVIATLLTPYHIYLYGTVFELMTQTEPFRAISELLPLQFRTPWDWFILLLVLGGAMAMGRQRSNSPFLFLLFALGVFLVFRARRDRWIVVMPALTALAMVGSTRAEVEQFVLTKVRIGIVAVLVVTMLVVIGRIRGLSEEKLVSTVAVYYPDAAARFIEQQGYQGPMFNHFNWGGYLIWRLPHLPVVMDGRTNIYGDERLRRHFQTWLGEGGWGVDADLRAAQVVLAPQSGPLTSLLRLDPRFELVYEDHVATVFVPAIRRDEESTWPDQLPR